MRALLAVSLAVLASTAHAAPSGKKLAVGNWTGSAFVNDKSREFSHCAVSARYNSGITIHVSVTRGMSWLMGFSSPNWKLVKGSTIPIQLVFQGRGAISLTAEVRDTQFIIVDMPDNSALIKAFRESPGVELRILQKSFPFALTSTSRMLPVLVDCVRENTDIVARPAAPAVPASPPLSQPGVLPKANDDAIQLEAVTLATNFLLASQIPSARVLKPGEGAGLGVGAAAWRANDSSGQVRIIPPRADQKGIDVAAAIVASDARECGGKFASGRTAELVDSDVLFRGFSSCDDSSGLRYAEYYVVPRKKGGFAVFSVAAQPSKTNTGAAPIEERRSAFQKAAIQATD